jgi:hypothetical protein
VDVDRRDDLARRVRDPRGHRRDPLGEFVVDPGVAGERHRPEPFPENVRIRHGPWRQGEQRTREVAVHRGGRAMGEEDEP